MGTTVFDLTCGYLSTEENNLKDASDIPEEVKNKQGEEVDNNIG